MYELSECDRRGSMCGVVEVDDEVLAGVRFGKCWIVTGLDPG